MAQSTKNPRLIGNPVDLPRILPGRENDPGSAKTVAAIDRGVEEKRCECSPTDTREASFGIAGQKLVYVWRLGRRMWSGK